MFMKKTIDIYMTDKNFKVLYVFKNVRPYKIILPKKGAYSTIETEINKYNYQINDIINFI